LAQKYPKPPIIEALLQIRYTAPLTAGELKRIPRLLEAEYPKSREENDFSLRVSIEMGVPTGKPEPEVSDHGTRMLSANDQRIVLTRQSSVLYAYQAPYQGWNDFVGGAHFVFDTLREKLGYMEMSSIGLRYVNRIDVPIGDGTSPFPPAEYLLAGVALPPNGIMSSLRLFQVVTEIEINHDQLIGRIGAATAPGALIDHASLLFDIDIISQVEVPKKADEFWALLDRMRNAKNAIFESGVTDKARQLFGWRQ
jgi:uncharacterized protein (TIGR04255 family)